MEQKSKDRLWDYFFIGVIATIIICISMRIWEMDFNILPAVSDDKMLGTMLYKSIKEYGLKGIFINLGIGAPEVSSLIDTPFIDYPMCILIWITVNILPSSTMAFYCVYILSYPLAAVSMLFLLNRCSTGRLLNVVMSILFAVVPYHFLRESLHSTLSCYYAVPIGIYLALVAFHENFVKGSPELFKNSAWKKMIFWLSVIYVGLSNVYYAFFSMLIILTAIVYKMIEKKSWKPVVQEARIFYVMALAFLAGLLPKILYGIMNGTNALAGIRTPAETEIYSLKIIQLLLPPSYSRVNLLKGIADKYNTNGFNVNENAYACLGVVGKIGFIILCIWVIVRLVKGSLLKRFINKNLNVLACFTLVLVLFCTTGGFGTIFSYVITPELRCLNRVSIFIEAICFLAVSLVLNELKEKIEKQWINVIVCLIFIVSLILNVPITQSSQQQISKHEDKEYRSFFEEVQNASEKNDMIYQLPMVDFPEAAPLYNLKDYSLFLGYVYADSLRWSYGGERGRNDVAMSLYIDEGMSQKFVEQILKEGFNGIYIDTYGFEDGGSDINDFYHNILGLKPIISKSKRLYFYSLKQIDKDELQKSGRMAAENSVRSQMEDLYFAMYGEELPEVLCEESAAAARTNDSLDYNIIYMYLFDSLRVNQISNERFVKEIYKELLRREPSKDELNNWNKNLGENLTRKDLFVQVCFSDEYKNIH